MATVNNPRKQFQFSISINGMNPALAQEVTLPDAEFAADEHGEAGRKIKTAGMESVGMLKVNKICDSSFIDTNIWNWRQEIMGPGGDMGLPINYKRIVLVEQYAPNGITVIARWEMEGVWLQKINGVEFNRGTSGNTVESFECCVDTINKIT